VRDWVPGWLPATALLTAGIVALFASASLFSSYRLGLLAVVALYTVASLAQNLLSGYADIPSLGNIAFFAIAGYTAGELLNLAHWPVLLALLGGVVAAGFLGFLVGLPALRISGMHLAIVTVALVFVGKELMDNWDQQKGQNGVTVVQPSWLVHDRGVYVAAVIVAAFAYLLVWNLLRARSGRAILALSDNPYAAAAVGIAATRYRLATFILCGSLTGAAGVLYLYHLGTVTSGAFTLELSLAFLTMMILGGSRSLGGSLVGALIIGFLPDMLNALPATLGDIDIKQSIDAIYAVLLLITLRFFPEGLWNVAAGAASSWWASRHPAIASPG
jgi:branched-chain amino acid transport system permease protein